MRQLLKILFVQLHNQPRCRHPIETILTAKLLRQAIDQNRPIADLLRLQQRFERRASDEGIAVFQKRLHGFRAERIRMSPSERPDRSRADFGRSRIGQCEGLRVVESAEQFGEHFNRSLSDGRQQRIVIRRLQKRTSAQFLGQRLPLGSRPTAQRLRSGQTSRELIRRRSIVVEFFMLAFVAASRRIRDPPNATARPTTTNTHEQTSVRANLGICRREAVIVGRRKKQLRLGLPRGAVASQR